jgi:hypothetical protein
MGASDFDHVLLFVRSVLWDIGVPQAAASILYEDNNACIAMAMAQKPTPQTRHMDIEYHVLVEWVERDLLQLECIATSMNLADHFMKQLGRTLFHQHINYILGRVPLTYSSALNQFCSSLHKHITTPDVIPQPKCSPVQNTFAAVTAQL